MLFTCSYLFNNFSLVVLIKHGGIKPGFTTDKYSIERSTNFHLKRYVFKRMRDLLFVTHSDFEGIFPTDSPDSGLQLSLNLFR